MNYRAWLNDDPASNDTIDFVMPHGSEVPDVWDKRISQYHFQKQRHVAQYYKEVVALKLICLQYKLPKDLFNLLKNDYIRRPVEKPQPKKNLPVHEKYEEEFRSLVVGIAFCICFVIVGLGIYGCAAFYAWSTRPTGFQQNAMSGPGPRGPPGMCGSTCVPKPHFTVGPTGPQGYSQGMHLNNKNKM